MSTKTKQELVERALQILVVLGAGQTPSAEDSQAMGDIVRPLLDRLNASDDLAIASEDLIDTTVFEPLAGLLANAGAPTFGGTFDQSVEDAYIAQIKRVTRGRPTYRIQSVQFS